MDGLDSEQVIEEALCLFERDPLYLVEVLRRARLKRRKKIRKSLSVAVAEAKKKCTLKVCVVAAPCGVGSCPHALSEYKVWDEVKTQGSIDRPEGVWSPYPSFGLAEIEEAIASRLERLHD